MQVQIISASETCIQFVMLEHYNEYGGREMQLGADVLLACTSSPLETLIDQSMRILLVGKKND
jgi:hypothetical protein